MPTLLAPDRLGVDVGLVGHQVAESAFVAVLHHHVRLPAASAYPLYLKALTAMPIAPSARNALYVFLLRRSSRIAWCNP